MNEAQKLLKYYGVKTFDELKDSPEFRKMVFDFETINNLTIINYWISGNLINLMTDKTITTIKFDNGNTVVVLFRMLFDY